MRIHPVVLRAASTVTILGTALATVLILGTGLITAPAQASGPGANTGQSASPHLSAAATAARGGQAGLISGVVDGAGGRPLVGACVVATGPAGSVLAVTRADGRYSLGGLRPGGYTLHYSACGAGGQYVDQWSGGASWPVNAATVSIARGQARELAPVTLRTATSAAPAVIPRAISRLLSGTGRPGGLAGPRSALAAISATSSASRGAIAGKVTGGGKPLAGICVFALGPAYRHVNTSKTGRYRISKLSSGRYYVFFAAAEYCGRNDGNWLPQYYKGANGPVFRHPVRVRVAAGKTTGGIDAALRLGGEISGTVRGQRGGPLSRVCVFAQGKDGRFFVEGNSATGKKGHYALHSLFPGKYQVAFVPRFCGNSGNLAPQWWPNKATQKHAKTIVIKPGLVVGHVDATLHPGAILSGVVRAGGPHGALLKGICVFVEPTGSQTFPFFGGTRTGKNGSYRVVALTTGKYRVFFNRGCGNNGNYLPVQRTFSIVTGHTRSGFDAFLPAGAIISGTVTNTHGAPIRGVCVSADSRRGGGGGRTNAEGKYSIIALPTGSYTLDFSGGCGNPGSYAPQFYRGQVNLGSAKPVAATAGHTTPGIDATMQPGGTITGVVTDASGKRLNRVCVLVEDPSVLQYGFPFNIEQTRNGVFSARNLTPGVYAVNFNCIFGPNNSFASQWFMGRPGQSVADFVSAPAGVVTGGVNAVLRHGGFITGVVTNSAGKPVSGACVQVTPHGGGFAQLNFLNYRSLAFTNSHGVYRLGRIAAGKYDVQFRCQPARYGSEWYKDSASRAAATPVTVRGGLTAAGVDAVLTASGSISGEVTTGANHPQPNVCVLAENDADNVFSYGFTNRHGQYSISGLSSGSYRVTFFDCGFGRHHVPLGTATSSGSVMVTAPKATGLNEKLFPGGSISGTVLGGSGATPQAGACVVAVPVGQSASYDYTATDSRGRYQVGDIAPGKYDVYFGDPFCAFAGAGYAPQWYKDQASQATATAVTVTARGDAKGIDASLGADGAISGTVTAQHHVPVAGECVTAAPIAPVSDPAVDETPRPVIGETAADGTYTLVGLLPGKYKVEFSSGCGNTGYPTQWWRQSGRAGLATPVTVSANATATGIDAHLGHHHNGG